LEEDPVEPNLLFLGTEFGLYVSFDRGDSWIPWRHGVPAVPVRAVMVHPRDHDLVLGTHGRGAYILDDIRPLRALASTDPEGAGPARMFSPPPAYQVAIAERIGYRSYGHAMFFGENRPFGAMLTFWAPPAPGTRPAEVSIQDASGEEVWAVSVDAHPGLNRLSWNLREVGEEAEGGRFSPPGPFVLPGSYSVVLDLDGIRETVALEVLPDPRNPVSPADRQAKARAMEQAMAWSALNSEATELLRESLAAVGEVVSGLDSPTEDTLREQGEAVKSALESAMERLFTGPECQGICGGDPVAGAVRTPLSLLSSSAAAPSPNDRAAMARAVEALTIVVMEVNRVLREEVDPFRNALAAAGVGSLPDWRPLPMPSGG
jgi:hypothetical protein